MGLQSDRVTETKSDSVTPYTCGWNIFMPIFKWVDVKFVWQILGTPAIFITTNVVANLFHKYMVPHIAGRFEK